jgi:hypothetical protein
MKPFEQYFFLKNVKKFETKTFTLVAFLLLFWVLGLLLLQLAMRAVLVLLRICKRHKTSTIYENKLECLPWTNFFCFVNYLYLRLGSLPSSRVPIRCSTQISSRLTGKF